MADFSPADVAFTGLRVVRRRPKAVAVWVAILFAAFVLTGVLIAATVGAQFAALQQNLGQKPDPAQVMAVMQRAAPIYTLGLVLSLVLYPAAYAAANRVVLRPEESRNAYLRLGGEELNQFVLMLILWAAGMAVYFAAALAGGAVVVAVYFAARQALPIVSIALVIAAIGGSVYALVRLSLVSAVTFDTGRLAIREAWELTRGRFWPLFWTYVLVWLLMLIVVLIGAFFAFTGLLVAAFSGGDAAQVLASLRSSEAFAQPTSAMALLTSPGALVFRLLMSGFYVLTLLLWLTPAAAVYQRLKAAQPPAI